MKPLFRLEGIVPCIHSEFFVNGSLGVGNVLAISDGKAWHTYIEDDKECLQQGLEFFSSSKYKEYARSFRAYIEGTAKEIINSKFTKNITNVR